MFLVLFRGVVLSGWMILPPREHLAICGDIFSCHDLGWGCYWHLVGRGLDCGQTSYTAQEGPPRVMWSCVSSSQVKKILC